MGLRRVAARLHRGDLPRGPRHRRMARPARGPVAARPGPGHRSAPARMVQVRWLRGEDPGVARPRQPARAQHRAAARDQLLHLPQDLLQGRRLPRHRARSGRIRSTSCCTSSSSRSSSPVPSSATTTSPRELLARARRPPRTSPRASGASRWASPRRCWWRTPWPSSRTTCSRSGPSGWTPRAPGWALVCYAIQIYFDFSGYSDMAIGLARMFGFHFLENFDHPYFSRSITEFWRRWHISLSRWFRDYLYVPLGGNRGPPWRTYPQPVRRLPALRPLARRELDLRALGGLPRRAAHRRASRLGPRARTAPASACSTAVRCSGWPWAGCSSGRRPCPRRRPTPGARRPRRSVRPGPARLDRDAGGGAGPDRRRDRLDAVPAPAARAPGGGGLDLAGAGAGWLRDAAVLGLLFLSVLQVASGTYNPFIYFRF